MRSYLYLFSLLGLFETACNQQFAFPVVTEQYRTLAQGDSVLQFSVYPRDKKVKVNSKAFYHYVHGNALGKAQAGYIGRVLHGPFQLYTRDKELLEQGAYEQGLKTGTWYKWHKNGLFAAQESYKKGLPQGEWRSFYDSGALKSKEYFKKGEASGRWYRYYPSGQLAEQLNYRKGKLEGKFKEFYPTGKLKRKGHYRKGELQGKVISFSEKGERSKQKFRRGIEKQPKAKKDKNEPEVKQEQQEKKGLWRRVFPKQQQPKQENKAQKLKEKQKIESQKKQKKLRWWPFKKKEDRKLPEGVQ